MQHFLLENSIFNLTNRARIVESELIYLEKFESGLKNTSFWPGCSFLKISKSIKVNWTANSSELKSIGLWDSDTASLVIFFLSCFCLTIFFSFCFLRLLFLQWQFEFWKITHLCMCQKVSFGEPSTDCSVLSCCK